MVENNTEREAGYCKSWAADFSWVQNWPLRRKNLVFGTICLATSVRVASIDIHQLASVAALDLGGPGLIIESQLRQADFLLA